MQNNLLNPLIISLLFVRSELNYLELILEKCPTDDWPSGYYEDIMATTDKFYRIRDKLLKIFTSTEIDYILYALDKNNGVC